MFLLGSVIVFDDLSFYLMFDFPQISDDLHTCEEKGAFAAVQIFSPNCHPFNSNFPFCVCGQDLSLVVTLGQLFSTGDDFVP